MNFTFDAIPLWILFLVTVGIVLVAVEIGFRMGIYRSARSEDERQAPIDAMVGSTLGLLAFVLAFTFGMATSRFDVRTSLVVDDAVAIRTADMRAQVLPEPHRSEMRALLREYVDVRLKGVLAPSELPRALARSEELQRELWSRAAALGRDASVAPVMAPLMGALIQMVDLHDKRINFALRNRIPATIWVALYCMTTLAMAFTGYRAGIAGRRSVIAILTTIVAFASVILLIADLDRPQEGLMKVSQQAMMDLQTRLKQP